MPQPKKGIKTLEDLRRQLSGGEFEFSWHAFRRAVERNISEDEIKEAGGVIEVIEDYPFDKYAPSVLLLCYTRERRPLHIHASLFGSDYVKIITIYEPDKAEWVDYRQRR